MVGNVENIEKNKAEIAAVS